MVLWEKRVAGRGNPGGNQGFWSQAFLILKKIVGSGG